MNFSADLPTILIKVNNHYLTNGKSLGFTEGYLISVKAQSNKPLLFTVHLETGALWSGLPIEALRCEKFEILNNKVLFATEKLQPYSCLEGDIQVIQHKYLKNYPGIFKVGSIEMAGYYLFTIDYCGEGLSDDPTQFKTHNIIQLENGQLAALPNNYCKFLDNHFVDKKKEYQLSSYKRNTKNYLAGS